MNHLLQYEEPTNVSTRIKTDDQTPSLQLFEVRSIVKGLREGGVDPYAWRERERERFQDEIPKYLKSHLIYEFKCGSCEASDVSKTFRHFQIRFSEHLDISKLSKLSKPLSYCENTATAARKHQHHSKHKITSETFKIIDYPNNESHFCINLQFCLYKNILNI